MLKTPMFWGTRFDRAKHYHCQVKDEEGEPVFIIKYLAGCDGELFLRAGCDGDLLGARCDGRVTESRV